MNPRILELEKQATETVKCGINGTSTTESFNRKKFAELLVKEFLGVVESNIRGPHGEYDYSYSDADAAADSRAQDIYDDIKHHFGVEE